ncbi:MAG: metal ABC transporter substrate-binding protein, partial [Verrucomicrobiota bacterium]
DWTEEIAGESIELSTLARPGQDVHTFEATPRQLAQLEEADVVIELGLGMEYWLDDLLASTDFSGKRITLTDALSHNLRHLDGVTCSGHHHADHHHFHTDPHVWMDPVHVKAICLYLTHELKQLNPEAKELYEANYQRYADQLDGLHEYLAEHLSELEADERKIITYHHNLGYLADRYGLEVVGTIKGSYSTEGQDPSARHLAELIDLVEREQVSAVFAESTSSPRLAQQLSSETRLPEPPVLYIETFAPPASDGPQDYLSMMRYTVDSITTTLQAGRVE